MKYRSLLGCVAFLTASFGLGFVPAIGGQAAKLTAGGAAGQDSGHAKLVQDLHSAHKLLAEANHDYKGHRAKAAHEVHKALRELGVHPLVGAKANPAGAAKKGPAMHEPQATSDDQLRQAKTILQGVLTELNGKHPKVAANVSAAIGEIDVALSIK